MDEPPTTLLIVDDEPDLRRLLSMGFRRSGYTVIEATTGAECLAAMSVHDIDLVLLDSGLPDIPGPEVVRRVRADPINGTLPILMVTGRSEISERVKGLRGGANDYVTKPVAFEELLARVEATLRDQTSWQVRLRERIGVHARLVTEIAAAFESDDPLSEVARAIRESLGFRRLVILHSGGSASILTSASTSASPTSHRPPQVIDNAHELTAEIRRLVGTGASLMHDASAQEVFGPGTGRAVLLSVRSSDDSMLALIAELDPPARSSDTQVREAIAGLTDLAGVIETTVGRYLESDTSIGREQILQQIERRAFRSVFQPICRLCDGSIIGYELLTRFDDGIAPDLHFAEARGLGLGIELELATLELGLEQATALPKDQMLSVNTSPSLVDREELRELLGRSGPRPISLELTENEVIIDYDEILAAVGRLPGEVRLAVDDAGAGWASLRHVHRLRAAFVKVDRVWVHGLHGDPARQILLRGLQLFVRELGGCIIAEGIEDPADVEPLRVAGVEFVQGYLFGRPAPIEQWLGEHGNGTRSVSV